MIADIIAISILLACIITGIKRGFTAMVFKLVSIGLSIWVATAFYTPIMGYLSSVPAISNVIEALKHFIAILILPVLGRGEVRIPPVLSKVISADVILQGKQQIALAIAGVISSVVMLLLFIIVVKAIIFLISKSLKIVTKLPVINQANKLLGGVVGFVLGICLCYIASLVIFMLQSCYTPFIDMIMKNSFLMSYFADTNALINVLI